MTKARISKLEKQFRADIRWAIRKGMKWDPHTPAIFVDGKWVSETAYDFDRGQLKKHQPKVCGVCAVAAHVVRHQTAPVGVCGPVFDCVESAAKNLRVDGDWLDGVFFAVMDDPKTDSLEDGDPAQLGHRLRDYAKAYTKKYRAEKQTKEAA